MSMRLKAILLSGVAALGIAGWAWNAGYLPAVPGMQSVLQTPNVGKEASATKADPQKAAEGQGATAANNAPRRPPVSVLVASVQKGPKPVYFEEIGTVQTVATVALRTRADATVDKVMVADGAAVKAGDVIVKLDSRQIEAQLKQAEATLAKDRALLEQANRDVARYTDLLDKQVGTQTNLDNARTQSASLKASIMGDEAQIDNLKVQLGWYTISAPISGRIGMVSQKAGNIVRSGDNTATGTLAVVNQTSPIYVSFSIPQRLLPDLRAAMKAGDAKAIALPQGNVSGIEGKIAVIDNQIDVSTGTLSVRAIFDNADEVLWPGQFSNVRIILRVDPDAVSIPREALQNGQNGEFVFVLEDGTAKVRPVKVGRMLDREVIIADGLKGGETVVTDGALQLVNGSKTEVRKPSPLAGQPGPKKGAS